MALTQDFKDKCENLLKNWEKLIGDNWSNDAWEIIKGKINKGKDAILNDPFFTSFKTRTPEEQRWLFKRMEYWYNDKATPEAGTSQRLAYCQWSLKDVSGDIGNIAVNFYELKNNFLKMVDFDKWDNTDQITALITAKNQAETSLKSWTDLFGTKTPAEVNANQEKHTEADLKPTNLPNDWKEQLATINNVKRYSDIWNELNTYWESDFKNEFQYAPITLNALKLVREKLDRLQTNNDKKDQALNKLLAIYKEEITKRTELFYQDLSLDNNWINEKYGDKEVSYLELLKNLTAESEPEECIKAFRIVALIKATEKAQETHDKYKDRLATLPANLKKNNLSKFNKIKETWDLITDEPTTENNPLYLPIITQKSNYITQIKNIITLWQ